MNQPRRRRSSTRRTTQPRSSRPVDVWGPGGPLPDVEPIVVPDDVALLLKTLGDPPTPGGDILASYFAAVVERVAAVAAALALSADLLETSDEPTGPNARRTRSDR